MSAMAPLVLLGSPKTPAPYTDHHCSAALEAAVSQLAYDRFIDPRTTRDPSVQLHLLASLIGLAEQWEHEEVLTARHAGATWAQIGRLLGVPAAAARARHPSTPHPAAAPGHKEVMSSPAH